MEYIFAKFYEKFPFVHNAINRRYRKRLKNTNVTLITSNCAGGIIYHWLGLKFNIIYSKNSPSSTGGR